MKHLESEDRRRHARRYDPEKVDPEFVPYLERINTLPFAASVECCAGHVPYREGEAPHKGSKCWGYLRLLMTGPSAVWLSQQLRGRRWLSSKLSQTWDTSLKPEYTDLNNFIITLAWDASAWPTPVEEICDLLDRYHAAAPIEPPHLLSPPRTVRRGPRPRSPRPRPR